MAYTMGMKNDATRTGPETRGTDPRPAGARAEEETMARYDTMALTAAGFGDMAGEGDSIEMDEAAVRRLAEVFVGEPKHDGADDVYTLDELIEAVEGCRITEES